MTGREHYKVAEGLLKQANPDVRPTPPPQRGESATTIFVPPPLPEPEKRQELIALAHAHATLALAAATALGSSERWE
jgi:hypothetical protein